MENQNFASELLAELKEQNKRLSHALAILIVAFSVAIVLIVGGFLWYMSLPSETVTIQSESTGNANYIGMDLKGDLINGENSTEKQIDEQTGGKN